MFKNKGKKCSVERCTSNAYCKGLCTKHYQQIKLTGKLKEEKNYMSIAGLCKNIGCGGKEFAKGMCQHCYRQERKKNAN